MGKFPIEMIALGKQVEILGKNLVSVETTTQGETYYSMFKGFGSEFRGHREYSFQDDSKDIDWKASLRSDKLLVKEYFQERGLDVVFVYDVSETMLFGSQKKIKAHYGAEFILALAGTAIELNYNVGLICISDQVEKIFLPSSGKNQIGIFFDILSEHSTYGGGFNLTKTLDFLDGTFNPGTVIIFVSDFFKNKFPFDKFRNRFKQLGKKFDIISVILRDPRDEFMPSQNINLFVSNPYGGKGVFFNVNKIKKYYESYTKEQKDKLKKFFHDVDLQYFELYTDKSFVDRTVSFFQRRDALLR